MTLEAKKEYIKAIRMRYKNAAKRKKGIILGEFCETTNLSRKHAIRLLNAPDDSMPMKAGPKPKYGPKVVIHLVRLWRVMNMCSVRMKAALPMWLQYDVHPELDGEIRSLLVQMSPSTIDRLLRPYRKGHRGLSSTEPSSYIKSKIPIELLNGKVREPGFIEADTVAHCGNSLAGSFGNSLTMTDLYSGWTENFASKTKTADVIIDGIKAIRRRLPFTLKGFACDNGSEFLNADMIKYLESSKYGPVKLVRRRPYKKNDNAHVEQKNDTHVRQLLSLPTLSPKAVRTLS
jgi:hypothetical protein